MKDKSIIKTPSKFLIQGTVYGDNVCVHILPSELFLTSLTFDERGRDIINTEANCSSEIKQKIYQSIGMKIPGIIKLEEYLNYSFLLACGEKGEIKLINVSYMDIPQSFIKTEKIAKQVNLETLQIAWKGIFSRKIEVSFWEDIIVQK